MSTVPLICPECGEQVTEVERHVLYAGGYSSAVSVGAWEATCSNGHVFHPRVPAPAPAPLDTDALEVVAAALADAYHPMNDGWDSEAQAVVNALNTSGYRIVRSSEQ